MRDWDRREPAWPAIRAIATLVSMATLLPLTEIDALELSLDDGSHLIGIVGREAAREVGKRGGCSPKCHCKSDLPMFGDPFRPLKWSENAVLVYGLDSFLH